MRILVVEDDQKLARQLKKGLDESGHLASLAFDGIEGLESAQIGEFDVLVLDVMLPRLDGISIVRQLRRKRIATPILLLTARDAPDDIITGLDAGADDYLTKPFSFKVLLARLRAVAGAGQASSGRSRDHAEGRGSLARPRYARGQTGRCNGSAVADRIRDPGAALEEPQPGDYP